MWGWSFSVHGSVLISQRLGQGQASLYSREWEWANPNRQRYGRGSFLCFKGWWDTMIPFFCSVSSSSLKQRRLHGPCMFSWSQRQLKSMALDRAWDVVSTEPWLQWKDHNNLGLLLFLAWLRSVKNARQRKWVPKEQDVLPLTPTKTHLLMGTDPTRISHLAPCLF